MTISIKNKEQEYPTPKIKIRSLDVINKTAAGEIVERPTSIVKEAIKFEFENLPDSISNT